MSDELSDLIDALAPALAAAFLAVIAILRAGIDYTALLAALRVGDIDAAIDALNIDRGAFSGYLLERQAAFGRAGAAVSESLTKDRIGFFKKRSKEPTARQPGGLVEQSRPPLAPAPSPASPARPGSGAPTAPPPPSPPTLSAPGGGQVVFRFDMTNPRAEAKIRTEAASRVAGYVDEQVETARKVIADGFARGEGPQSIATTIAGKVNPISGRREGGIIGLSDPQVNYAESMRARLLSGDPEEMMKVLGSFDKEGKWKPGTGMTLRDRRYDSQIKKAIREVAAGKPNPLTADRIEEMAAKYADRLLKKRAEDISRTETAQGVLAARAEAIEQALTKDGLSEEAVSKTWRHLGGLHAARDWHVAMNNKKVEGLNAVFFLPDGSVMKHAHDPEGGAKNNVACRCDTTFDIDWAAGL